MRTPVRARTRIDHISLETRAESTLSKLGFEFLKNQGELVTEFEVVSPSHFRVVIESLDRTQWGYPLRNPFRVESAVALSPTVGHFDSLETVASQAASFVAAFRSQLPPRPWKEMGILASRYERRNWEKLAEFY